MKKLTDEEIRWFFLKREFARPRDWDQINKQEISLARRKELTFYINGYLSAKSENGSPYFLEK